MAFTYDLATSVGQIRLTIADTTSTAYAFEDAELTYFYSQAGTINGASRRALKALIADAARRQRMFVLPGMTYDDRGRVSALVQALAALPLEAADLPTLSVITPASLPYDSGYVEQPVIATS